MYRFRKFERLVDRVAPALILGLGLAVSAAIAAAIA
jgi:hypothetical protein